MTPEFTALSSLLDQSLLPETIFSSVYETQMSDIFTSLAPTMETTKSFPHSEFSRSTLVPDATQVMSTITDISWTDVYEIISTEVFEYITTDVYDSRTLGTGTDEYQVSTLFPTLGQPGLQTESTLVLSMSEEMPLLSSVVMETTVLPIDTIVVSYEMSSVLFTLVETSSVMPITPSMPSVYPVTSDRQVVTDSTAMFTSETGTTSLVSLAPSFLYSTVMDLSTILVSDTITDASSITDSTVMFTSEIGTTSLESFTPSFLYSTVMDLSTILVTDTITDGSSITDSTVMFSSEIGTASLEPLIPSPLYSTVIDVSTILVSDPITDASSITDSTAMFSSEIGTSSLESLTPSFIHSTVLDLSTILVTDTITNATSIIDSTVMFSSEIGTTSLVTLAPSFLYSTVMDLSTILVTDTITDASSISESMVMFSSESGTPLESVRPSLLYSTVIDLSTILVSDIITDASWISPSSSEYYPSPSTPSFASSILPSLPFFTPILPSFTETPYLDTSSILIYTTVDLESSFPSRSSEDLTSLMPEHSEISYSVSHLSSRYMPSDYLTETLLTSEMVSVDITDTFPVLISSTGDYLTLVVSGSDTIEPSSLTGTFETISTRFVESSASERIPLLTLTESIQITSLDTLIYTTVQDTVITDSLVTLPTTILEYSSSASSVSSIVQTLSSRMPEVSTTEVYETVSSATTDFIVPPFSTMALVTSSIDIMPSPSTAVGATSMRTAVEASIDSSLHLETLSIMTPTSEVYETRTMSPGSPIISSLDTNAPSTLSGSYSSMFIPPFITLTPVQTTDYVISTMIGPTTSTSETYILTEGLTPQVPSSSYAAIDSSDVLSNVVTDTVSLGSMKVSSDASTSTLTFPSPSDSLRSESSGLLSTLSGTPPLTSLPSFTTSSLFQSEESPSTLFTELTPTLILSFSSSEVFLSSSVAPQETISMILSTSSQMVTPSIPPTDPPMTTATESPVDVPLEFQLTMDIKVPTSEDISADDFSEALSNNLEVLYIEGESNTLERRKRSNSEADTPSVDSLDHEWIFTRKQQTGGHPRIRQRLELQEQYALKEDSKFEGLAKESSAEIEWMFVSKQIGKSSPRIQVRTENKVRRKRQADPSDDIEVPILALSRSDNVDPETVTLTFYVMENETLVMATDAAATYNTLTEGEMSAQLGYAVRSIPHPVIPTPTTTPDYPYTIPPADQTDWLKVTLIVDTAFDETNATFQKQLRNDLEE
ncbi:mucin-3A-like [Strongylocentrotus purpuratus]|uniref:Uncharacterized protein n=1 Tax=Strongylocentrotus purpuratus TaxID=7668 RepID=A0A7M7P3P8_STRPU|nr:mucin-3A-like [Strongylocentrotus purpuratus]